MPVVNIGDDEGHCAEYSLSLRHCAKHLDVFYLITTHLIFVKYCYSLRYLLRLREFS